MAAITQLLICSAAPAPGGSGAALDLASARAMLAGSRLSRHTHVQITGPVAAPAPPPPGPSPSTLAGTRLSRRIWRNN